LSKSLIGEIDLMMYFRSANLEYTWIINIGSNPFSKVFNVIKIFRTKYFTIFVTNLT